MSCLHVNSLHFSSVGLFDLDLSSRRVEHVLVGLCDSVARPTPAHRCLSASLVITPLQALCQVHSDHNVGGNAANVVSDANDD
ncbi:unnamed protein product [Protopolystoma xenopodis]|uniref:Uncharacterized protein n=1 Tax=Protopolystoma xenopodis TaxID=117903 RepID=A0A3S4ZKQ0_9PLAT|nr:unnamed protein product [Protopolystoma xenopodis]